MSWFMIENYINCNISWSLYLQLTNSRRYVALDVPLASNGKIVVAASPLQLSLLRNTSLQGQSEDASPTMDCHYMLEMIRRGRRTSYIYHYLLEGCSGDAVTTKRGCIISLIHPLLK